MKILFIGDVVGKSARETLKERIKLLKSKYKPDVIIVNAENATGGYGLSKKDANDLLSGGVDVITLGNHAGSRECLPLLKNVQNCKGNKLPIGVPGKGYYKLELINGKNSSCPSYVKIVWACP